MHVVLERRACQQHTIVAWDLLQGLTDVGVFVLSSMSFINNLECPTYTDKDGVMSG